MKGINALLAAALLLAVRPALAQASQDQDQDQTSADQEQ